MSPPSSAPTEVFTPEDEALLAFGQKAYTGSIDLLRENAKSMVTLISGLFAVYFAILTFLGFSSLVYGRALWLAVFGLVPPFFLIAALLLFVWVSQPVIVWTDIDDLTVLQRVRSARVIQLARRAQQGLGVFVIALILVVLVALAYTVVGPPPPPP